MKHVIVTIAACLVTVAASAHTNADIEVSYTVSTVNFRQGGNAKPNHYVLLANANESKFYSPQTEYLDSLQSTPEGDAKYQEMVSGAYKSNKIDDIPRRDGSYYVLKSIDDDKLEYYDVNGIEKYCYEERLPEIDWEIADGVRTILGYECVQATGDYHGRKWTVWFTPDIPIVNGPWKLGCLPGLILEAKDDSGLYTFIATGIQSTQHPILPVYSEDKYEKVSRKDFLKTKRKFVDNPMGSITTQLGGSGISIDFKGDEIKYKSREEVDFIETDY